MPDNPESRRFLDTDKQIRTVPGIETHHQTVIFQYAEHFMTGRLEPFRRIITRHQSLQHGGGMENVKINKPTLLTNGCI
jgi:hypothetical protein